MKKIILLSAAVLLIAAGCNSKTADTNPTDQADQPGGTSLTNTPGNDQTDTPELNNPNPNPTTPTPPPVATPAVKSFSIVGSDFKFTPNSMTVNKGDTVKITFTNSDENLHNFVLDQFNVRTTPAAANKPQTVQFVADKTGSFEFYCSVGNHRQMGMVGTLVVK